MDETPVLTLSGVVLDSPDARELAAFYRRLLGWAVQVDEPDWVRLRSPAGGAGLSFQTESRYVRPVWPAGPGDPQMSVHLDIVVEDPVAAGPRVLALGAAKLDGENVYADPAGHPFCLIKRPGWAPPIPVGA